MKPERIKLLNTYVDNVSMKEAIDRIEELIKEDGYHYVVTPNVAHVVQIENDEDFRAIYNDADLVLTDGMPLIWISKAFNLGIKEKVSGSDLVPKLCERAAKSGHRVFFMGAAEGVAKACGERLTEKYPGLNVVGTYSPPFGFEKDEKERQKIFKMLEESKPDILFLGVGSPKQERFLYQYKNELKVPVSLGIGAAIDFEAGNKKRAPKWMQKSGLEGFYRFGQEPKRMFKRVFIDDFKIFGIAVKYAMKKEK